MPVRPWSPDPGRPSGGIADGAAGIFFGLGELYERIRDLDQAAGWYRRAAEAGHPDAALRLGAVLGRLADTGRAGISAEDLLAEATRWLSGAPDATTPDAIELITDMLNRHQRQAARRGVEPAPAG